MTSPSDALQALGSDIGKWVFHYPVYINTFCLAYHLAELLDGRVENMRHYLVPHDWSQGIPHFLHTADVEFFIATEPMIEEVREQTNCVEGREFTKYRVGSIFVNRARLKRTLDHELSDIQDIESLEALVRLLLSIRNIKDLIVITDVPQSARLFAEELEKLFAKFSTSGSSVKNITIRIRGYWQRDMTDLFERIIPKIYLFSAPIAAIFEDRRARYIPIDIDKSVPNIPTFVAARYAADIEDIEVQKMLDCIETYYKNLFDAAADAVRCNSVPKWAKNLSCYYGRHAESSRQMNPFSQFGALLSDDGHPTNVKARDLEYLKILDRHHGRLADVGNTAQDQL